MSWHALETRGYVVVPRCFAAADCAVLAADFARGAAPESYPHGFKLIGRRALEHATARIDPVLAEVRAATALRVDAVCFLTLSHYITTARVERTAHWHQDFDLDFALTGDHIDYLNFWVPIAKPERARSNVSVVPFDALAAASPEAHALLRGAGGHRLIAADGRTAVHDGRGLIATLDADLDALAETPELDAGDLLLMRGDLIHRTQDADTARVAASIRATSSTKWIRRERLGAVAPDDPGAALYATVRECFEARGGDAVSIGDLLAFARGA